MGFPLNRIYPVEISVDGAATGQAIVNTFQFKAENPAGGSSGSDSQTLLTSFRTWYRTNFLASAYADFGADFYWLRYITGAATIAGVPPGGPSYVPVYGPMQDVLAGGTADDQGDLPSVGDHLPTFVAMNFRRITVVLGRRYWRSSIRVGPFTEDDQGLVPQYFNDAAVARWSASLNTLPALVLSDGGGALNGWIHAVFSSAYHDKVNQPLAVAPHNSTQYVASYLGNNIVTTQRSRKLRSSGGS